MKWIDLNTTSEQSKLETFVLSVHTVRICNFYCLGLFMKPIGNNKGGAGYLGY